MRQYRKRTKYSANFKETVLKKVFADETKSISSIAKEQGMPHQTLAKWVKKATSTESPMNDSPSILKNPFPLSQKFHLLLQSQSLTGEDFGKFLRERRQCLFSSDIEQWKKDIASSLAQQQNLPRKKGQDPNLIKIAQLEKEIALKDRTLAEASILLLLKKKHLHLWTEEEESEEKHH